MRSQGPRGKLNQINEGLWLLHSLVENVPPIIDSLRGLFLKTPPPGGGVYQPPPSAGAPPFRPSPYEVLGLPEGAGEREFRQRYRELMRLYHRDRGSGSDAMAKRINQAWDEIKKERGWK